MDKILSESELKKYSIHGRREYFQYLRECILKEYQKTTEISEGQIVIDFLAPKLRNYDFEVRGLENIPRKGSILLCNHSNSHDFFTAHESFKELDGKVNVLVGSDCLNFLSKKIFKLGDTVFIDRNDKKSANDGLYELAANVLSGNNVVIFGEATWNLHPTKPMQAVQLGASKVAAITEKTINPVIFEYVEVDDICRKEKDLYKKCIVYIGKPIIINCEHSLIDQSLKLEQEMIEMRLRLWKELGIKKDCICPELYVNHTCLKKFGALGFEFDSKSEEKFLYYRENRDSNEWTIDKESGLLVPGITSKEEFKRIRK